MTPPRPPSPYRGECTFERGKIDFARYALDRYIRGGVPRGKITQIYGEEMVGKTSLTFELIKSAQKLGIGTGFLDAELSFDARYAATVGVDLSRLWLDTPLNGERVIRGAIEGIQTGELQLLVIDSVGAMVPKARFDAEIGKVMVAERARLVTEFTRRVLPVCYDREVAVVMINHLAGTMKTDSYGNEITRPEGGKKLQYFSTLKLRMKRASKANEVDGEAVSREVTVKIDKNKVDVGDRSGLAPLHPRPGL